jgi:acyl-CoA synthetase (NDP forming)
VRALARVVGYAVWLRTPDGASLDPSDLDIAGARTLVNEVLREHPEGADLDEEQATRLLAAYGIESWPERPVSDLRAAQKAGRELGWDVVLKATASHLRERPDLAHVWRNIGSSAEMRDAWESLHTIIRSTDDAGFVVQKNAPPGVPVAISSLEDPLFGPVVSFGIGGLAIELLQDRSYRIPRTTRRRWCARSSRHRCCSDTAARRWSTSCWSSS